MKITDWLRDHIGTPSLSDTVVAMIVAVVVVLAGVAALAGFGVEFNAPVILLMGVVLPAVVVIVVLGAMAKRKAS